MSHSIPKSEQSLISLPKFIIIVIVLPLGLLLVMDYIIIDWLLPGESFEYWWVAGLIIVPKFLVILSVGRCLMRYAETHFKRFGSSLGKFLLFMCLPMFILIVMIDAVDALQRIISSQLESQNVIAPTAAQYKFSFNQKKREYRISGVIDFGITRDFRSFIAQREGGQTVVLDSLGGSIYEGRGLANLFQSHNFNTHVDNECSSACTLAFIGGLMRTLGHEGKLGFHQYGLAYRDAHQEAPFFNPFDEQVRDQALFIERGVDVTFVARIFDKPPSEIWFPDHSQLLRSGLVDAVK